MAFHVFVLLLVSFLIFSLAPLWSGCEPHPGSAQSRASGKMYNRLHRLLKPRSPDDCQACRLASTRSSGGGPVPAEVASLAGSEEPTGSPQADSHRRLRLSHHNVPLLWHYRCSDPRGFLAMASMGMLSGSKRSEVLLAAPRSALDAILRCII